MSGYGMDAFLTLGAEARRRMLSRALITVGAMTALAAAAVAWPLIEGDSRALAAKMTPYLIVDGVSSSPAESPWSGPPAAGIPRGRPSCWCSSSVARRACTLSWRTDVGISERRLIGQYRLDPDDMTRLPAEIVSDPNRFGGRSAKTSRMLRLAAGHGFAPKRPQRYVLAEQAEPIFQAGLTPTVVGALSGVTHPVFWFSDAAAVGVTRPSWPIASAHTRMISVGTFSASSVSATGRPEPRSSPGHGDRHLLTALQRARNSVRLAYRSDGDAFLNALITYDHDWRATVNGTPVPVWLGTSMAWRSESPRAGRSEARVSCAQHRCLPLSPLSIAVDRGWARHGGDPGRGSGR